MWLNKILPSKVKKRVLPKERSSIPDGSWVKCPNCLIILHKKELDDNAGVCTGCDHHLGISARTRMNILLCESEELFSDLVPEDILQFKDLKRYKDRIGQAGKSSGEKDAMLSFQGKLKGRDVVACAMDFSYMGGSMGRVVGEKFVRSVTRASENGLPFLCFSASGGARMQEGLFSLMQMARTSAVLHNLSDKGLPFVSILCHPTMGGVSASFAMLGDVIVAEPKALIGFAGPRVIQQVVREKLPEGFQRSEFLLEHGAIDAIVHRKDMKDYLGNLLDLLYPA